METITMGLYVVKGLGFEGFEVLFFLCLLFVRISTGF